MVGIQNSGFFALLLLGLLQFSGANLFDTFATYISDSKPVETKRVLAFIDARVNNREDATALFEGVKNNKLKVTPVINFGGQFKNDYWNLEAMKEKIIRQNYTDNKCTAVIIHVESHGNFGRLEDTPLFGELAKWMDSCTPQIPYVSYQFGQRAFTRLESLKESQKKIWEYPIRDNLSKQYPQAGKARAFVPLEKVLWEVVWPDYKPVVHTAPFVTANEFDWADKEDIFAAHYVFNEQGVFINRMSHAGRYDLLGKYKNWIVDAGFGFPRFPGGRTGISGRGNLGKWGPNHAIDVFLVRYIDNCKYNADEFLNPWNDPKCYEMLALMREYKPLQEKIKSTYATPGGLVNDGDTPKDTMVHEFVEECFDQNVEIKEYEMWHTPIIILELDKFLVLSMLTRHQLQPIEETDEGKKNRLFKLQNAVKQELKDLEMAFLSVQKNKLRAEILALENPPIAPNTAHGDNKLRNKIQGMKERLVDLEAEDGKLDTRYANMDLEDEYHYLHLKLSVLYQIDELRYSFGKEKTRKELKKQMDAFVRTKIATDTKRDAKDVSDEDVAAETAKLKLQNTKSEAHNLLARNNDRASYRNLWEFGITEFLSIHKRFKEIEELREARAPDFEDKIKTARTVLIQLEKNLKKKVLEKIFKVDSTELTRWRKVLIERVKDELVKAIKSFRDTEGEFQRLLDIVGYIGLYKGICDDSRNTDNSWMETICYLIFCNQELYQFILRMLAVKPVATVESMEVGWHNVAVAQTEIFFASHRHFITMFIKHIKTLQVAPPPTRTP